VTIMEKIQIFFIVAIMFTSGVGLLTILDWINKPANSRQELIFEIDRVTFDAWEIEPEAATILSALSLALIQKEEHILGDYVSAFRWEGPERRERDD
jgi:hypothetical protein